MDCSLPGSSRQELPEWEVIPSPGNLPDLWIEHLPTSWKSSLNIHWKDWCWNWSSSTLATWCEEPTHWKRPSCWERLKAGGEGHDRRWDGWMASPTQWTGVWASSGNWWWTGRPGVLQSMGSQRGRHDHKEGDMTERLKTPSTAQTETSQGAWHLHFSFVVCIIFQNHVEHFQSCKNSGEWWEHDFYAKKGSLCAFEWKLQNRKLSGRYC